MKKTRILFIVDIILSIAELIRRKRCEREAEDKARAAEKRLADEQARRDADSARAAGKHVEEQLRSADKVQELNRRGG